MIKGSPLAKLLGQIETFKRMMMLVDVCPQNGDETRKKNWEWDYHQPRGHDQIGRLQNLRSRMQSHLQWCCSRAPKQHFFGKFQLFHRKQCLGPFNFLSYHIAIPYKNQHGTWKLWIISGFWVWCRHVRGVDSSTKNLRFWLMMFLSKLAHTWRASKGTKQHQFGWSYPLVNLQKAIENSHRNSGFTH